MVDMRDDMMAAQERDRDAERRARMQAALERRQRAEQEQAGTDAAPDANPRAGAAPGMAGMVDRITGGDPLGAAGRVASGAVNVGRETPGALWHGFADAVNETMDLVGEVQTQIDLIGAGAVARVAGAEDPDAAAQAIAETLRQTRARNNAPTAAFDEGGPRLPTGPEQETAGGQFIESMTQFVVGFLGAGKARTGANIARQAPAVLRSAVDSALASFTVFDGHEARLADMVESVPELQNPVTEFLASNEDDPELVGRMKNALEDIGTGALADSVIAGIRAVRGARRVRDRGAEVVQVEQQADEAAQQDFRDIIRISGDPEAALIQPAQDPSRLTMDMLERSRRDLEDGIEIGQPEAEALIDTAERWAAAVRRQQPERARSIDDLAAEWRERGDPEAVRGIMDAMDEARAPVERPPSLIDFLRDRGGIIDESAELASRDLGGQTDAINRFTRSADRQRLDDAAMAAWEAGYFPDMPVRPTVNDLLDAVDADARALAAGDDAARRFSIQDDDAVAALKARQDAVDLLEEWEVNYTDRSARARERSARDAAAERAAQQGEPATESDLISMNEAMEAAGAQFGVAFPDAAALGAQDVRINFNALKTSDDIQSLIGQLADSFSDDIAAARGPTRGNATLIDEQSELGSAWNILGARRRGEPLTDSQVIAAQRLYIASAENVRRSARMLTDPSKRPANLQLSDDMLQFNLRRAISVHRAVQAEIAGAKADAGRALRAWQVVTGTSARARNDLLGVLDQHGGRITQDQAVRLANMGARELDQTARYVSTREAISAVGADVLRFMFLSGPPTHIMNMAGNSLTTVYDTLPRLMAGVKGKILGDPELEMQLGAALAQYTGLRVGLAAQFRAFSRSADYGRMGRELSEIMASVGPGTGRRRSMREALQDSASTLVENNPLSATMRARFDDMGVSGRKLDDGAGSGGAAVSAERFGVAGDSPAGRMLDGVGRVLSAPTEFLGWQDDFFKGVNEVAERHALAYERAARELSEEGITRQQFAERYRFYVENPTDDILQGSRTAAQRRTFTEPIGQYTRLALKGREGLNRVFGVPLGHLLLPFVVTPSNILKFAFQSSPFGFLFKEVQDDLAAGGARRAMAQSRMAAGTGLLMYGIDLAAKGQITGSAPSDPGAREQWERMGLQEYSIRVGDRWVSYRRLEPVSTMLAIGADVAQISQNVALDDDPIFDAGEVIGPALGAAIGVVTDKTYLTGISELIQFIEDPDRYGTTYIERTLSSVTTPALLSQAERALDPEIRAAHNAITQIQSRLPGFSDELPQEYDLWGRPRVWESGVSRTYDVLSPFTIRTMDPEPIDQELYRIGLYPRRPAPRFSLSGGPYDGVEVNLRNAPHIYQRYVELAGNGAPLDRGMGAKDLLNAIVEGRHSLSTAYQRLPDSPSVRGSRADMIEQIINDGREAARVIVQREFRDELNELARRNQMAEAQAFQRRQEEDPLLQE